MVTFTGSNVVGGHVMRQAASSFKRVVLELGGKSPNVLLPGADVEAAVGPSILRFCRNAGQACAATTRTFVQRDAYEHYVDAARAFMATLPVGDPWNARTVVGPLIRAEHRARVEGFVERALAGGGIAEAGGGRPELERGWYMNPLLVGNVGNDAEISQQELFGPVGVVIPYDTVEEAVALANASRYGLNANVWGPSRSRGGSARAPSRSTAAARCAPTLRSAATARAASAARRARPASSSSSRSSSSSGRWGEPDGSFHGVSRTQGAGGRIPCDCCAIPDVGCGPRGWPSLSCLKRWSRSTHASSSTHRTCGS